MQKSNKNVSHGIGLNGVTIFLLRNDNTIVGLHKIIDYILDIDEKTFSQLFVILDIIFRHDWGQSFLIHRIELVLCTQNFDMR